MIRGNDQGPFFAPGACKDEVRSFRLSAWKGLKDGSVKVDSANGPQRTCRLKGIDLPALEKAVRELVKRHPVLGARIMERDGWPWLIKAGAVPKLHHIDCTEMPHHSRRSEAQRRIGAYVWAPFEFADAPLMRVYSITVAPDEHYFGIVVHHFICDHASVNIAFGDLCSAYQAAIGGAQLAIPGDHLDYFDYLHALNEWFDSAAGIAQRQAWIDRLARCPDMAAPRVGECPPSRDYVLIDNVVTAAVNDTARHLCTTPFVVLLAAQATLLAARNTSGLAVLKTVTSGRETTALLRVVGNLADRLYVVVDLSDSPGFPEAVRRTAAALSASRRGQAIRFEVVQRDLLTAGLGISAPVFNFHPASPGKSNMTAREPADFRIPEPPVLTQPGPASGAYWLELHDHGAHMVGHFRYPNGAIADLPAQIKSILAKACGISTACTEPIRCAAPDYEDG